MSITGKLETVSCTPYTDQTMGTSGLRKKTSVLSQPHYLDAFVCAVFDALAARNNLSESTLVVGGDGRYLNKEALNIIFAQGSARGVHRFVVPLGGLASTPAVSRMIRNRAKDASLHVIGGFILTASHNPAGPKGDFGFKVNLPNGGPALKDLTDDIYARSKEIHSFTQAVFSTPVDLSKKGEQKITVEGVSGNTTIEVIDPVDEYLAMVEENFDIEGIRAFLKRSQLRVLVDSLNAVTGVYTKRIFCDLLGLPVSCCVNNVPLEDFGGKHADPNLVYAKELVDKMWTGNYDFGCAFDGDGDRNMILGNRFFITPSDSLAMITAHNQDIRYFREKGFHGVARSMPTSAAVDKVAESLSCHFHETPTGWKFFGNLMDAGRVSLCGEESFGTGSDLIREKDGIWAALAWLSMLTEANKGRKLVAEGGKDELVGVQQIAEDHWRKFGRNYYRRYDYENVESDAAHKVMDGLRSKLEELKKAHGLSLADDFAYTDPVDHSCVEHQGVRLIYANGSRIIFRLSGTGSVGATIRVYFDMYEADKEKLNLDTQVALQSIIDDALSWSNLVEITGRKEPSVIT